MATLTITPRPRLRALTATLTSTVVGLAAGAGLMALVGGAFFDSGSDAPIADAGTSVAAAREIGALRSDVAELEAINELSRSMLERLTAGSSASVLPPAELDELHDRVLSRAEATPLTLEELNVMFDEAFGGSPE